MRNLFLLLLSSWFCASCTHDPIYLDTPTLNTKTQSTKTENYSAIKNAYFGDLHTHTSWSFDAFIAEVRSSPDDAYRFGKGESIPHVSGTDIKLNRPLDFMAVSDHAEYMGAMMQMLDKDHPIAQLEISKNIQSDDISIFKKATRRTRMSIALNWPYKELLQPEIMKSTWQKIVESADRHYNPGTFTTFPAFEWTSSLAVKSSLINRPMYAQNLHRNVIFKGGKVSGMPFSSFDSQNPEHLWEWMELQRKKGVELLAIPHNGNISDGQMYASTTFDGDPIDKQYADTRFRNEPVSEVAQNKGQSMTHPLLSPNDEFADFEVYQYTLGNGDPRKPGQVSGSFVREAFKNGLAIEKQVGSNPFQFGVIGSTDCHNGASNVEEDNTIGKSGMLDPTPAIRLGDNPAGPRNRKSSVAGLAAVWSEENTRASIYEALERKEVYATSGTRIKVRFFASWESLSLDSTDWVANAYDLGVPMGGALSNINNSGQSPSFLIWATKDAEGANLDRIQVVKGWLDNDGITQEKIFEVAWSDDRVKDNQGQLPPVGNTVNLSDATYTNTIGEVSMQAVWKDPEFDVTQSAFYYLRVLEIPTPRWTTYDAVKIGVPIPEDVPSSIQERAWSSPIWYKVEELEKIKAASRN